MRFMFLADMQLGCYATFSGVNADEVQDFARRGMRVEPVPRVEGFEWDANRFRRAIQAANELRPDAVVIGGDMVEDASDEEQLTEFFEIAQGLDGAIRLHMAPGNHDIATDAVTPTSSSIARYRERFGADFYAVDHDEVSLIVTNTVVAQQPQLVPDEWERQLAFLERTLVDVRGARPVIIVGHHPWFVADAGEADTYWNLPLAQRRQLIQLAEQHEVRLVLAGHWHRNAIARHAPFEMVTSGPVGYPLGDDPSGYRIVQVEAGTVSHSYHPLPDA